MTAIADVEAVETVGDFLSKRISNAGTNLPLTNFESLASVAIECCDELRQLEQNHLSVGKRESDFLAQVESTYQRLHQILETLPNYCRWESVNEELRKRIATYSEDVLDDIERYRRGRSGRERLTEYFRDDI